MTDDGPGLPVGEDAAELFGRFARGETRGDGTGLGLSVVRALAEAHGGSARLEPARAGGARAVVRFPIPPPHAGEGDHEMVEGAAAAPTTAERRLALSEPAE